MSYRILIVEDEPRVRTFIEMVLSDRGYTVQAVTSAAEARQVLTKEPADARLCLVIDVVLERESGIELAHEAFGLNPDYRVLLMSGYTDDVLVTFPSRESRIAFLRKPFTPTELLESLKSLCEGP